MGSRNAFGVAAIGLVLLGTLAEAQGLRGRLAGEEALFEPIVPPPIGGQIRVVRIAGNLDMLLTAPPIVTNLSGERSLVAANTVWQFSPGVFYVEARDGYLWSLRDNHPLPASLDVQVFEVDEATYFVPHRQTPHEIADGGAVVGSHRVIFEALDFPFRYTRSAGVEFLPLETTGTFWSGEALAVSLRGDVIGGYQQEGYHGPHQACLWSGPGLDSNLVGNDPHSTIFDLSDGGRVAVGETGPDAPSAAATRWENGVEVGLDALPGQTYSTARYVSDEGRFAIGWATVGGKNALVRWDRDGSATAFLPPNDLSVREILTVNAEGTAVGGSLELEPVKPPLVFSDGVPFVWRLASGFHVLDELGLDETYDLSTVTGVSADGRRAVGQLAPSLSGPTVPPARAFLWELGVGSRPLDEVLAEDGQAPLGLFAAAGISADGRRVVAMGDQVSQTLQDTSAVLMELPADW